MFRITTGAAVPPPPGLELRGDVAGTEVHADPSVVVTRDDDGRLLLLAGEVDGRLGARRALEPADDSVALLRSIGDSDLRAFAERHDGSFVVARVGTDGAVEVAADRFGTRDVYLQEARDGGAASSSRALLPHPDAGDVDQAVVAHALLVYGTRPPKRHTLRTGSRRLGPGELASIRGGLDVSPALVDPPVADDGWGDLELGEYADAFLDALEARGSRDGNVVYLSSGWDSTSILAGLVHVFGRRRNRAVIGRMRYSDRSGVCNQFEMDRARAVADHFGIRLDVVELDYVDAGPEVVEEVRPLFRSHDLASLTGLNHARLAAGAAATAVGDEAVFAGEISDGAHNLGFSQFVTLFHPVQGFREYADKMGSYLFGPTFLRSLHEGRHEDDLVYRLFRDASSAAFEKPAEDEAGRNAQILSSLLLRSPRIPLVGPVRGRILTDAGLEVYRARVEEPYLAEAAASATPETIYAWYLWLYNSFHWQGSTVATLRLTAEQHGLRTVLPYWDRRVQDLLAVMPESCGRGLDLNPTKHPLKWMLRNRVDYPHHLQVGPHSYTYDVDPTFNHSVELLYHSTLRQVFVDALKRRPWEAVLEPEVFDLAHLGGLTDRFLAGEVLAGADLSELTALGLTAVYDWYS